MGSEARVFISYSHDTPAHAERVLALSERLRADGIDTRLDQYVKGTPAQGWPRWMLDQLDWAHFVLLLCTATYYQRFRGHGEPDKGKGVAWEGAIISQEIYDARSTTTRFVPLLLDAADEGFIPEPVRGHSHYVLRSEQAYRKLYDFMLDQAGAEPGPIGAPRRTERRRVEPLRFADEGAEPSPQAAPTTAAPPTSAPRRTGGRSAWPPEPASLEPTPPEPAQRHARHRPEHGEFTILSPERVTPNSFFVLDVWAYLPDQYCYVIHVAETLGREHTLGKKSGVPIQRGSLLTIRTEISTLDVPDPVDTIFWDSSPSSASFIVGVPAGTAVGTYPGKASIGHQGITIAKIVFLIAVAPEKRATLTDLFANTQYPITAFASYARENRDEVFSRIRGMKRIAPNLDIFVDVFSLRSGQFWLKILEEQVPTKDIFYLFWSRPASCSEWVEREWKIALQKRGIDYIDPVPLEEPDHAPPPPELASLHFYDAYVAYITYEQLKSQIDNLC